MSADVIAAGRAALGIELGSTRIKACLVDADNPAHVLATGSHEWENQLVDGLWTYALEAVHEGLAAAYSALLDETRARFGTAPTTLAGVGVSAMMHGYLAFDADGALLTNFRTWRNTNTGPAAAELSTLFGTNIPLRWSIAHLHQAITDAEAHVPHIAHITTLAGYVHEQLTEARMLGVGDASGMFPVSRDSAGRPQYDPELVARYDALLAERFPAARAALPGLGELLPSIRVAGETAGHLTEAGARLLDPSGTLAAGAPAAPPEGDAGTGMVATNAVAPRTGNVSVGTSIFAMVVLDRPLASQHAELDLVTTPAGDPVAMVHCNNGTSELNAWVGTYRRFAELAGTPIDSDAAYALLFAEALEGAADADGVLAYNQLSGEPVAHLDAGRPAVVRTPDSRLTLANVMRAQVYGVFATLAIGMRALHSENVAIDALYAHGGMFRTPGVAQRFLGAALDAPVGVAASAAEGGAWGIAVLAAFTAQRGANSATGGASDLGAYLDSAVFAGADAHLTAPLADDVAGFTAYLDRYEPGLAIERTAAEVI
ncbi:FGGY-family carbohydrate kinase [Microcella alkaliphila]|uniref:Sugar (Pentulose and hexulose) kinase n=1 Tax=Microcella alkaliphila TaxID=279828 RepID=A0A0U5BR45_9MICO|nr:FGGY-family carbohydrate kinase [Microcella alkaliphila]BAU33371.1 sugar (pentulose and hexulose) kinase [Microcella alkaliphila]